MTLHLSVNSRQCLYWSRCFSGPMRATSTIHSVICKSCLKPGSFKISTFQIIFLHIEHVLNLIMLILRKWKLMGKNTHSKYWVSFQMIKDKKIKMNTGAQKKFQQKKKSFIPPFIQLLVHIQDCQPWLHYLKEVKYSVNWGHNKVSTHVGSHILNPSWEKCVCRDGNSEFHWEFSQQKR